MDKYDIIKDGLKRAMNRILQQEKELEKLRKRITRLEGRNKPFKPPTQQEVRDYLILKGINSNTSYKISKKFCDYYESCGWMVGKKKMKSWKHAIPLFIKEKTTLHDTLSKVGRAISRTRTV